MSRRSPTAYWQNDSRSFWRVAWPRCVGRQERVTSCAFATIRIFGSRCPISPGSRPCWRIRSSETDHTAPRRPHGGTVYARAADPLHDAWLAFSRKQFVLADSLFRDALRKHPDAVDLRLMRARALFYLGKFDGAVAELEAARDTVSRDVEKQLSPILPSVEMFDFAIGIARVQQDDFPAARVAFERALTQNLAFYWAHTRLAGSALALHDTATALTELDMATELEGRDPVLLLYRGVVRQAAGRLPEADQDFRKAIELDPYYAEPYYFLATNRQVLGDTAAAVVHYREFLRRAARADAVRPQAVRQLTALGVAP